MLKLNSSLKRYLHKIKKRCYTTNNSRDYLRESSITFTSFLTFIGIIPDPYTTYIHSRRQSTIPPIGSYFIERYKNEKYIVLKAQKPSTHITKVHINFLPDAEKLVEELLRGDLDLITDTPPHASKQFVWQR